MTALRVFWLVCLVLLGLPALTQDIPPSKSLKTPLSPQYEDDLLLPSFHRGRREALRKMMPAGAAAVFFSNPVRNRSNDVDYEFHQDPDFYYLTGYREPDAMLIIFKEPVMVNGTPVKEVIFVRERDPRKELWNGRRLGVEGAMERLEIEYALSGNAFRMQDIDFASFKLVLADNLRNDILDDPNDPGDLYSLTSHFKQKVERQGIEPDQHLAGEWLAGLRQVKLEEEMKLLRKAIDITCQAQMELMRALEPGFKEYQAEAIVEYIFKKHGAEHWGFPSILGGGENSCVLHYTSNRKPLINNELLVVDIGAEYHGYTADVTRTIPVDGSFSNEQLLIYNIVLKAQKAGIEAARAGNRFWAPHDAATAIIRSGLQELGIISSPHEATTYFMHGTSHYLGLDVHDAGLYGNLAPGNVITVEPGIYIPEGSPCDPKWWNIGIRIEDDILITAGEPENLSASVPREAAEIEKLMQEPSLFNVIK